MLSLEQKGMALMIDLVMRLLKAVIWCWVLLRYGSYKESGPSAKKRLENYRKSETQWLHRNFECSTCVRLCRYMLSYSFDLKVGMKWWKLYGSIWKLWKGKVWTSYWRSTGPVFCQMYRRFMNVWCRVFMNCIWTTQRSIKYSSLRTRAPLKCERQAGGVWL